MAIVELHDSNASCRVEKWPASDGQRVVLQYRGAVLTWTPRDALLVADAIRAVAGSATEQGLGGER
jgi:hypothetical protein